MIIRNSDEIISQGHIEARKLILNITDSTLRQVNYHHILQRITRLEENILQIGDTKLNLDKFNRILLVGAGKNASSMTLAYEEILGDRISDGVIIEKKGCERRTGKIPLMLGGHPTPDEDSVKGAEKIVEIASKATEEDLLIVMVSGGLTALTFLPPQGIPLKACTELNNSLLKSGMPLEQMNIVRNHLSRLGRGKLPFITKATVLGLIAVDEIGGQPWGPTVPDKTTFQDAIRILKHYNLLDNRPASVKRYLQNADPAEETPKEEHYRTRKKVHNVIVADNRMMCEAAKEEASKQGIDAFILSTTLQGEAKDVGITLASLANEVSQFNRPFKAPCLLIAGGEPTVTITTEPGEGGRNQEMALSAARYIAGNIKTTILSLGTDGTDGPTNIAGAIVDGTTIERAKKIGIDVEEELRKHNSSRVFRKINDALYTSDTGTNLMDLILVYVD